jgi:ribosome biogenesis GTPase
VIFSCVNSNPSGIVAANFGKELAVLCEDGSICTCELSSDLGEKPVPGDRVSYAQSGDKRYLTHVAERKSVLRRAGKREGEERILASHIDLALVISAVKPALKEGLIDRYLVALHHEGITPVIVLNKADLDAGDHQARLQVYADLGYATHLISAKLGTGIPALRAGLSGKTSVLVGQSGVGKSSVLMALVPEVKTSTQAVSAYSGKGVHTTTTARLYATPDGVRVIDSPGIRSFGLSGIGKEEVRNYFVEFEAIADHCRFRNCLHFNDDGCAVRAALDRGEISKLRYESYLRIVESL